MSDKGRAYVEQHSPYKGAFYLIHYRLGDIENDTHGHRLWIADHNLAYVCRCTVKTVQRAKARMVKEGFLEKLSAATGRSTAEYLFLYPKTGTNIDLDNLDDSNRIGGHFVSKTKTVGGHSGVNSETSSTSTPTYITELKEGESLSISEVERPVDLVEVRRRNDEILGRRRAQ